MDGPLLKHCLEGRGCWCLKWEQRTGFNYDPSVSAETNVSDRRETYCCLSLGGARWLWRVGNTFKITSGQRQCSWVCFNCISSQRLIPVNTCGSFCWRLLPKLIKRVWDFNTLTLQPRRCAYLTGPVDVAFECFNLVFWNEFRLLIWRGFFCNWSCIIGFKPNLLLGNVNTDSK